MARRDLLEMLIALAAEAGVTVRTLGGAGPAGSEPAAAPRSGACRIRGRPWLLLAPGDPLEERIAAAAAALAGLGEAWREGRYLPPAVREAVEAAAEAQGAAAAPRRRPGEQARSPEQGRPHGAEPPKGLR